MRQDNKTAELILFSAGLIPVLWIALLLAPTVGGGLAEMIPKWSEAIGNPFIINWCEDSMKTVLIFSGFYAFSILVYHSTKRNYRRREEHGSAKWGDCKAVNKRYRSADPSDNKLLTQNVRIGFDGKKHRRNLKCAYLWWFRCWKNEILCQTKCHAMQHINGHT